MKKVIVGLLAVAGLAGAAQAQIRMVQLANIDVFGAVDASTPANRIGTNVSAVAWNGSRLFIAGNNNGGGNLNTGIAEVLNPLSSPSISAPFALRSTASTRGHVSLSLKGNSLFAGWDNGAAALGGFAAWDTNSTASATWQANLRGAGTSIDPGFGGVSTPSSGNLGIALLGSGRRQLLNASTGAVIYSGGGGNAGFIFNNAPTGASTPPGSNHRDLAFDTDTGDVYARVANSIVRQLRTGENSGANASGVSIFENYGSGGQTVAANTNQQNIAFGYVNTNNIGKALFFNDRPVNGAGTVASAVKAINPNGGSLTIDWGSFNASSSTSAFDFSFDQATNTLAISDFSNSRVYIFQVVPTPGAAALIGVGGLVALRRRR
jgi:hypothetical protein